VQSNPARYDGQNGNIGNINLKNRWFYTESREMS